MRARRAAVRDAEGRLCATRARARASPRSPRGLRLRPEAQTREVAAKAQQARGILDEAGRMQHAQAARSEIVKRGRWRAQLAALWSGECQGDRVDGEVAALEVLLGAARAHL